MKVKLCFVFALSLICFSQAQVKSPSIQINTNQGILTFYGIGVDGLELSYSDNGEDQFVSHARASEYSSLVKREVADGYWIQNGGLEAYYSKETGSIDFYFQGELLTSQSGALGNHNTTKSNRISFNISEEEKLYGGGERVVGMNRRGHNFYLYNKAHYGYEKESELMNFTLPIVLSSKRYMIHFDNPAVGHLDLDSRETNTISYDSEFGPIRYQIFASNSWGNIIKQYTSFSGRQPMLPRWALGNFASRFGYHSQREVLSVARSFREQEIPLDAVVLDLYWFGKDIKGHMGNLQFDRDSFPDPVRMLRELKDLDVKTILITEPFVLTSSKRWEEAVANNILAKNSSGDNYTYDFYFGNTGLVDVFNPQAKTWFWDIYKNLTDIGVSGWWGDLGEPEVHPEDMIHHGDLQANQVHNIYGNEWAKLISEGYSRDYFQKRPFILMRSGYSGAQRYGLIPWSGDVNRTWGGLFGQTEIALQMGMQGIAFMHSDLGGFAGPNEDNELYTRWLQYGVFQPIFRPHGQEEVSAEPIFKPSKIKALAKTAIELRYSLLPYNYNLVFENHQTGIPLMRPLLFEEPNNMVYQSLATTYLWGADFLISPVVQPDIKSQEVHFPKTSDWFDFYTDEKIEGGSIQEVTLQDSYIPTYVRSGAFIPRVNGLESTEQYDMSSFDLHFYFGSDLGTHNRFFNDDGHTKNALERGEFEFVEARSKFLKNTLEITLSQTSSSDRFKKSKKVNLIIHNIQQKPKWVKLADQSLKYTYDKDKKTVSLPLELKANSNINIVIKRP